MTRNVSWPDNRIRTVAAQGMIHRDATRAKAGREVAFSRIMYVALKDRRAGEGNSFTFPAGSTVG